MRKLIVWNMVTVDGCFEGATPWNIDFHNIAWGPEFDALGVEQEAEGDLLVFGRKTYEGMAAYWTTTEEGGSTPAFMNRTAKLVASRSLREATWQNTEVTPDPVAELTRRKAAPGGTIFVFGSGELTDTLLTAGVVDEIRLGVVPVLLGTGNPLFKLGRRQVPLTLLDARPTTKGALILRYRVGAA